MSPFTPEKITTAEYRFLGESTSQFDQRLTLALDTTGDVLRGLVRQLRWQCVSNEDVQIEAFTSQQRSHLNLEREPFGDGGTPAYQKESSTVL